MTRCEYCVQVKETHGIQAAGMQGFVTRQICDECERKYTVIPTPHAQKPARRPKRAPRGYIERSASL